MCHPSPRNGTLPINPVARLAAQPILHTRSPYIAQLITFAKKPSACLVNKIQNRVFTDLYTDTGSQPKKYDNSSVRNNQSIGF
eukprot:m.236273 g.236273  ORF g.236273 m.236273 type:complete len:83 (+) comp15775_c1_seq1:425-673(+)